MTEVYSYSVGFLEHAVDALLAFRGRLKVRVGSFVHPFTLFDTVQYPITRSWVIASLSILGVTYHSTLTYLTLQPPTRLISFSILLEASPPPAPVSEPLHFPSITCVTVLLPRLIASFAPFSARRCLSLWSEMSGSVLPLMYITRPSKTPRFWATISEYVSLRSITSNIQHDCTIVAVRGIVLSHAYRIDRLTWCWTQISSVTNIQMYHEPHVPDTSRSLTLVSARLRTAGDMRALAFSSQSRDPAPTVSETRFPPVPPLLNW